MQGSTWAAVFGVLATGVGAGAPLGVAGAAESAPASSEGVSAGAPAGPFGLTGALVDRFDALTASVIDHADGRVVADVHVRDRFLDWHLVEGALTPVRLAAGEVVGGWFVGRCTVSYVPPAGQEADAFRRTAGVDALKAVGCSEAFLLTDDGEVLSALGLDVSAAATTRRVPSPFLSRVRIADRLFDDPERHHAGFAFAALGHALAPPGAYGVLNLTMTVEPQGHPAWLENGSPLITFGYSRDPGGGFNADETVSTRGGNPIDAVQEAWGATLTSHPWEGDPETTYTLPNLDVVSAHLDLDITVEGARRWAEMEATAEITLTTRTTATATVTLDLLHSGSFKQLFSIDEPLGFEVLGVTDYLGRPLEHLHRYNRLIVRLVAPLEPGVGERLTVRYRGNAMPRVGADSFGLLANYAWWPQPGHSDRITWKARVCTPSQFLVAGTGTTVSVTVEGSRRCEQLEEKVPIGFPAINMGRWKTAELEGPHGIKLRGFFLASDRDQILPALQETKRALEFYEGLFGPYPYEQLDVAQSYPNMGFWQAPAGLVELSRSEGTVMKTWEKDRRTDFYPETSTATLVHEVGHQWWGHVVGWRGYRDQWVSETFAEYASFLYMAQHYGQRSYLGRLEYWEQAARESDLYGPAVLGFRLAGRGRVGQMYARGPFMLHMLRRLVGDEAFSEFTRTLARVVDNRNASTGDVIDIARAILGPDVDWFFDQWLFRTGLPSLEAEWRIVGPNLELTIGQMQEEEPFRLLVPIVLEGRGGATLEHVVALDGRAMTVVLPLPDWEVRKVRIDPGRELLCAEKKVREAR